MAFSRPLLGRTEAIELGGAALGMVTNPRQAAATALDLPPEPIPPMEREEIERRAAELGWQPAGDGLFRVVGNLHSTAVHPALLACVSEVVGNFYMDRRARAPAMHEVVGNAELARGCSVPALRSIGRSAWIYEGCEVPSLALIGENLHAFGVVQAQALERIGGTLSVGPRASFPALHTVGVMVREEGKLLPEVLPLRATPRWICGVGPALALMGSALGGEPPQVRMMRAFGWQIAEDGSITVAGDLESEQYDSGVLDRIVHVKGKLSMRMGSTMEHLARVDGDAVLEWGTSAPALASIGGSLVFRGSAKAPLLREVGGDAQLHQYSSAPKLESVGRDLRVYRNSFLPMLARVGRNLRMLDGTNAPGLTEVGGDADLGIGARAQSLVTVGGALRMRGGSQALALQEVAGAAEIDPSAVTGWRPPDARERG